MSIARLAALLLAAGVAFAGRKETRSTRLPPAPAPAALAGADAAVATALARMEELRRRQKDQDARAITELERQIERLGPPLRRWGPDIVPGLEAAARDGARHPRSRWWAAQWLAATGDPAAFSALKRLLLDPAPPEAVRTEAAHGLHGLGVSPRAVRAALEAAIAQDGLPAPTLYEALLALGRLGVDDAAGLGRRARAIAKRGDRLRDASLDAAIRALARSRTTSAAHEQLALFAELPPGSGGRAALLESLLAEPAPLALLGAAVVPELADMLEAEARSPRAAAAGLRLLARLGARTQGRLIARFLDHEHPEVLGAAAEAAAALAVAEARPKIAAILAGAHADPRFAPGDGRPDPTELHARLRDALRALP